MKSIIVTFFTVLCLATSCYAQPQALTFEQAAKKGKSYIHLDSLYKSAIHSDSEQAVFKSEEEQLQLQNAYQELIIELAKFLKQNNFSWGKKTRCFNRIYFDKGGTIDYFLYQFREGEITAGQQKEFDRLLGLFIKDHPIKIKASEKFSQCSPIIYNDL